MKISVVCAPGVGDALIMHIVSHHLKKGGFEVTTDTPHRFGRWLQGYQFGKSAADAIFLQHDNSEKARRLYRLPLPVYTFFGSHKESKHGPLKTNFDFVADPNQTMVENTVLCLKKLFQIDATKENGFTPPANLTHRKYPKRVAIHASSSTEEKNWSRAKFMKVASFLEKQGLEPAFIPLFPSLDTLCAFIYESGYFIGNDSGPGHIASCLNIPHLITCREERQMRLWRPGWLNGSIAAPPKWAPRNHWRSFLSHKKVIKIFKNSTLRN